MCKGNKKKKIKNCTRYTRIVREITERRIYTFVRLIVIFVIAVPTLLFSEYYNISCLRIGTQIILRCTIETIFVY